jgi:DNA-binding protein YbaB
LLWFGNDEKKAKNDQKDTKQQSKSKMGTTATTMENFKQSQELGKKTSSLLNDLTATSVEGSAGKGKIKVIVDGQQRPKLVEIDEDYFAQVGVEDFTEALAIAMQDAHDRSTKIMEDKMASLYIELGLPSPKQ